MNNEEQALEGIKAALEEIGFQVLDALPMSRPDWGVDLIGRLEGEEYLVEVKALVPFRRKDLLGAMGHSILHLRQQSVHQGRRPLVALWLKRRSRAAASDMRDFMARHAPEIGWILADAAGWRCWQIGESAGEVEGDEQKAHSLKEPSYSSSHPYSPANQWLLKVLLLPGMDRRYWGGPEEPPHNISELGRMAGVSQSQASRLVSSLRRLGHQPVDAQGFRLHDLRRLLMDWSSHLRHQSRRPVPVSPIYPEGSPEEGRQALLHRLARLSGELAEEGRAEAPVVGSHYACHLLGLGRSNVESLRLNIRGPLPPLLDRLDLVRAKPDAALLEIARPGLWKAVSGGAVMCQGVWVIDALQCYLEVKSSAARGEEQAQYILERILMPHFRSRGWS